MKKINYLVPTWVPLFHSSGSGSELTHFLLNEILLIRIFSYISLLLSVSVCVWHGVEWNLVCSHFSMLDG